MVGYSIRGENVQSADTRLKFCTTGVLLRMFQNDQTLTGVSHIIVDEVHERGIDSDFLLVLLKDLIAQRDDLRVILMSATIDANLFSSYFNNCKVVEIEGLTYPVQDIYLENILQMIDYNPESTKTNSKGDDEDYEDSLIDENTARKLNNIENAVKYKIDFGLIAAIVGHITEGEVEGAILIFVSGSFYLI
jgi:HrpA-like RNA helicase